MSDSLFSHMILKSYFTYSTAFCFNAVQKKLLLKALLQVFGALGKIKVVFYIAALAPKSQICELLTHHIQTYESSQRCRL
jgi:hypothetical protein